MVVVVTVQQRKEQAVDRLRLASLVAMAELRGFAKVHGGRYLVFGSFARGDIVPDSDFDLLADFAPSMEVRARDFAETVCVKTGLKPDVHVPSEASDQLMLRVRRDGISLS